ncbi:MAG: 4-phosphoerythronate dehydrogenase [Pseudomonadales bacterium]|jgi:erythronate-4-phosphate dehydrogenase|nr:4-phosphoerythronate dehydrogenase [Pseudomonadales bacterium]
MRLLCDENLWGGAVLLAGLGELRFRPGREIGPADVAHADVLLLRSQTRIDAALLGTARPRFVGTATAGTEHVDRALLEARGVPFANAPGSNAEPVADWVMAVVADAALAGRLRLPGARCAVIGCGEVGGRVARRLAALGCEVLCVDPPRRARGLPLPGREVSLAEALAADLVTLHVPLTSAAPYATRDLLDAAAVASLRPGTVLLNAARGGVLDDAALLTRLRDRGDLHVALDVYAQEPAPSLELLERCRFATPHVAGHSIDGKLRGTLMVRDALCETLGLTVTTTAEAALPAPVAPARSVPDRRSALAFAVRARGLREDSAAFREALASGEEARAAFDRLRRDYGPYRDFTAQRVRATGEAAPLLRALGFAVVEV